ncbi:hypothetical protein [Terasakiella sp.]|uniref:hypothetical protein n=1 Tax=Terasakiella sp. TaxID=2034861 RepID=UPI003AA99127
MTFVLAFSRPSTARLSWSSCRYRLRNLNTVALGNGFKSSIVLRPSVYLSSRLSALVGAAYSEKQKKTEWANPTPNTQEVCHDLSGA